MNKSICKGAMALLAAVALSAALIVHAAARPTGSQAIYNGSLQNGWQPWGWAKKINYNNTSPVYGAHKSISIKIDKGYDALYVHHAAFNSTGYRDFSFWANGGPAGGQMLQIQATVHKKPATRVAQVVEGPLPPRRWVHITVPLAKLGVADNPALDGFWIQDHSGHADPVFYVDDIALVR